jgi:hypothetical protein
MDSITSGSSPRDRSKLFYGDVTNGIPLPFYKKVPIIIKTTEYPIDPLAIFQEACITKIVSGIFIGYSVINYKKWDYSKLKLIFHNRFCMWRRFRIIYGCYGWRCKWYTNN